MVLMVYLVSLVSQELKETLEIKENQAEMVETDKMEREDPKVIWDNLDLLVILVAKAETE